MKGNEGTAWSCASLTTVGLYQRINIFPREGHYSVCQCMGVQVPANGVGLQAKQLVSGMPAPPAMEVCQNKC